MLRQTVLNSVVAMIVTLSFSGTLLAEKQTSKTAVTSKSTINGNGLNSGLDVQQLLNELQKKAAAQSSSSQAFEGVININGREIRTKDPRQFQQLRQQLKQQFRQFPMFPQGFGPQSSSFSGVINNNGQVQKFDNPAAFKNAQQQLPIK